MSSPSSVAPDGQQQQMQKLLEEHSAQLSDVNALLASDPSDPSLIKLRDDLLELIELTKSEMTAVSTAASSSPSATSAAASLSGGADGDANAKIDAAEASLPSAVDGLKSTGAAADGHATDEARPSASAEAQRNQPPSALPAAKKKSKKSSKLPPAAFEVPPHLVALDSDTPAERKKKQRTLKALKSKWREKVKEAEGVQKQRSWQDFVGGGGAGGGGGGKKKRRKGLKDGSSIFATQEGIHARVGVISGGGGAVAGGPTLTSASERKRHTHHTAAR